MAITKVKVGGTIHSIGLDSEMVGSGLLIESGKIGLFASGDQFNYSPDGLLRLKIGSGLRNDSFGVLVAISGIDDGFKHGLEYQGNTIALKLGSGLTFDLDGNLTTV